MKPFVTVYDPSAEDELSRVRGVGRYMQILRENFPDWKFVHSFENWSFENSKILINPFINFLQPPVITKRMARRQIAVIHDLIPLKYPTHFPAGIRGRLNILRNRQALRHYDTVVTDSVASKTDIVKLIGIDEARVHVIYPCLSNAFMKQKEMRTKPSSLLPSPYIVYVGDVTWNKNLVNLARAVPMADVTCVFVGKAFGEGKGIRVKGEGSPWLREFHEFRNLAYGDKRFIFPGYVSDSGLVGLYANARANILVSRDEGFGFSFLEAASVGTPSILANIPVFQEISSDSALHTDPSSPDDIAQKIKILLEDGEYWHELKERAQKRSESFSPEKFRNGFSNLLVQ